MPHPMKYVPDVPGVDAPVLLHQASIEHMQKGFLVTVLSDFRPLHTKDVCTQAVLLLVSLLEEVSICMGFVSYDQAAEEIAKLMTSHWGTGPGFTRQEIDGCTGAEMVTMQVESDNYSPDLLAHGLVNEISCGSAGYDEHGNSKFPHVAKLIPMEASSTTITTIEELVEFVRPVVVKSFPKGQSKTFGVHYEEHSPNISFPHQEVVEAVAALVPDTYKVDIPQAEYTIVIVMAGKMCIASVCHEFAKFKHYNLHAISTEPSSYVV